MGSFNPTVQQPQTSGGSGKGSPTQMMGPTPDGGPNTTPQGKGASGQRFTYSPTSGQPAMGAPNQYTNTIGQWDNARVQQPAQSSGGKGKG